MTVELEKPDMASVRKIVTEYRIGEMTRIQQGDLITTVLELCDFVDFMHGVIVTFKTQADEALELVQETANLAREALT